MLTIERLLARQHHIWEFIIRSVAVERRLRPWCWLIYPIEMRIPDRFYDQNSWARQGSSPYRSLQLQGQLQNLCKGVKGRNRLSAIQKQTTLGRITGRARYCRRQSKTPRGDLGQDVRVWDSASFSRQSTDYIRYSIENFGFGLGHGLTDLCAIFGVWFSTS